MKQCIIIIFYAMLCSCVNFNKPCPPLLGAKPGEEAIRDGEIAYHKSIQGLGVPEVIPVAIRKPECGIYLDIMVAVRGTVSESGDDVTAITMPEKWTDRALVNLASNYGSSIEWELSKYVALRMLNGSPITIYRPWVQGTGISPPHFWPFLPSYLSPEVASPSVILLDCIDGGMAAVVRVRLRADGVPHEGVVWCELRPPDRRLYGEVHVNDKVVALTVQQMQTASSSDGVRRP